MKVKLLRSRAILEDRNTILGDFRNRIVAAMPACSKRAAIAFRFVESGGGKSDEARSQSAQYQSKQARNFPHGKPSSVPPRERHEEQRQGQSIENKEQKNRSGEPGRT